MYKNVGSGFGQTQRQCLSNPMPGAGDEGVTTVDFHYRRLLLRRHEMAQVPGRTIFSPVSKEDPKHGRWILPLVVLALVVFTYTFVTNLPPAQTPTTTTAGAAGNTTTTAPDEETTTTTTLPEEVVAFVATIDALSSQAEELRTRAQTLNDEYADSNDYGGTREGLSQVRIDTSNFNDAVAGVEVPARAADKWTDVTTAAAAMQIAADDMLDGLVNTAGSEKRLAALEEYNIAAATFSQELEAAKEAALEPDESE